MTNKTNQTAKAEQTAKTGQAAKADQTTRQADTASTDAAQSQAQMDLNNQNNQGADTIAEGPKTVTIQDPALLQRVAQLEAEIAALHSEKQTMEVTYTKQLEAMQEQLEKSALSVTLEENEALTAEGSIKRNVGPGQVDITGGDKNASHAPDVQPIQTGELKVHEVVKHKSGSEQVVETYQRPAEKLDNEVKSA